MVETDNYLRELLATAMKEEKFLGSLYRDWDAQVDPVGMPPAASPAVSLMITNQQRAELRDRGFLDEAIRQMTPAQAHEHLGLSKPSAESIGPKNGPIFRKKSDVNSKS